MKKLSALIMALAFLFSLNIGLIGGIDEASAAKRGGGFGGGIKSSTPSNSGTFNPVKKPDTSTSNSTNKMNSSTTKKSSSGFMKGLLFGGLAGLLLGGLFGDGIFGAILGLLINVLAIGVIIFLAVKIFRIIKKKRAQKSFANRY
jgi:predicted lipid-binding transport protein (Tim44 family)